MRSKALGIVLGVAVAAFAQPAPDGYLQVTIVRVKPEKRATFDASIKKMVAANRNGGSDWLTSEVEYGEGNTLYFTSLRQSYAEIEASSTAWMGAMAKAMGEAGVARLMQDLSDSTVSVRSEVRRRRMDLSRNVPAAGEAYSKLVGQSRWLRVTTTRLRPGRTADYEAILREFKVALERGGQRTTQFVAQSASGQQGTVFYNSTLVSSFGSFDTPPGARPFQEVLGPQLLAKFTALQRDAVLGTESYIARFVPELSNPAESIASVAPEFWRPKPPAPAKPKPKTS